MGLRYLADGQDCTPRDTVYLKYHLTKAIGFSKGVLQQSAGSTDATVAFGDLLASDANHTLAMFSGLKRLLDSPKQKLGPASGVRGTTRGFTLIGAPFVDVVPRFLASDIPLGDLPVLNIRAALDCLFIIVYKHDLEDNADLASTMLAAVKRATLLLLDPRILREARALVFSICSCVLKRFPKLVVSILGDQIMTCLAFLERHAGKEDPDLAQVLAFLHAAFRRYNSSGLFILLFRVRLFDKAQ